MAESITTKFGDLELKNDQSANQNGASEELQTIIKDLIERGRVLHNEVETYVAAVLERQKSSKNQEVVEYRVLRSDMRSELAFIKKIADTQMDEEKARHYIVSSNFSYYGALWDAAKHSFGLQSFKKYFSCEQGKAPQLKLSARSTKKRGTDIIVDIVAERGSKWIRVSTVSEKRLLFELAKMGWQNASDSDSDEDMPDAPAVEDDDDEVDIVKNARDLARAAKANPVHGRPPRIHFILTRIDRGRTPAIDKIIDKISATGAIVQCAADIPPPVPIEEVLSRLLIDRHGALSDTLNIDCTILLALISDISHASCPVLDWYPKEVCAQIGEEAEEHLLPIHLYPAIGSHAMVCTQEAADQMYLIVNTLATDSEKLRADLLLGRGQWAGRPSQDLAKEWASTSDYELPSGFSLPIQVVSVDLDGLTNGLPVVANVIGTELGTLNKSIFLYGWSRNITTLSSNRSRTRQIDALLNEHGLEEREKGPHIWLCGESRSLIAKHGRRG